MVSPSDRLIHFRLQRKDASHRPLALPCGCRYRQSSHYCRRQKCRHGDWPSQEIITPHQSEISEILGSKAPRDNIGTAGRKDNRRQDRGGDKIVKPTDAHPSLLAPADFELAGVVFRLLRLRAE